MDIKSLYLPVTEGDDAVNIFRTRRYLQATTYFSEGVLYDENSNLPIPTSTLGIGKMRVTEAQRRSLAARVDIRFPKTQKELKKEGLV